MSAVEVPEALRPFVNERGYLPISENRKSVLVHMTPADVQWERDHIVQLRERLAVAERDLALGIALREVHDKRTCWNQRCCDV